MWWYLEEKRTPTSENVIIVILFGYSFYPVENMKVTGRVNLLVLPGFLSQWHVNKYKHKENMCLATRRRAGTARTSFLFFVCQLMKIWRSDHYLPLHWGYQDMREEPGNQMNQGLRPSLTWFTLLPTCNRTEVHCCFRMAWILWILFLTNKLNFVSN